MSHLANALRAATAAALMGSFAWLAGGTATADPDPNPDPGTGNQADVNTLSANLSKGYGLADVNAALDDLEHGRAARQLLEIGAMAQGLAKAA